MNLRQQLISDRVGAIAGTLAISEDMAFLRFAHSLFVGQSIHSLDPADLVEGGQDKQIDAITIEQNDEEAFIYILSAKNTDTFSSNAIIQMRNGLDWIFNKPKSDLTTLANLKFRDRVNDLRSALNGLGYSNVTIKVAFVTNGLTTELSKEFEQEQKHILDRYDNGTFAEFSFEPLGADELINQIHAIERHKKKVDADIPIRYDANNPSLIKYHAEGLKGLVCSTSAREIAKLVLNDPTGSIFDSNIRRFLGTRGAVNSDILRTCTDTAISHQFWFLNNGITVLCDSFDPITDPDNPHVKTRNLQIVNGCQTATALAKAEESGTLSPDVRVLLRIYEAEDSQLVDKIVLTTNNQNKISNRDLRANDQVQIDMEHGFARYNFLYERKLHQYGPDVPVDRIVVNELVAQSYLAIVLKKPSDARRRKYKIWGELYDRIFAGRAIEPHVLSTMIVQHAQTWLRKSRLTTSKDDVLRKLANNGAFHIARIAAFYWRKSDKWDEGSTELTESISKLENGPSDLPRKLKKAFMTLREIVVKDRHYVADMDAALKSLTLEAQIDKILHPPKASRTEPKTSPIHRNKSSS
jgi:hypothetical protein